MNDQFFKLMLVTNKGRIPLNEYLGFIALCAKSGITSVQLREKGCSFEDALAFGKQLQLILKPSSIPLIVNDHLELACQLDADGVHLGQSDGNVSQARQRLGDHKIIGLTVDNLEQLSLANSLSINYVGIGAVFPTNNKSNITTLWGLRGLKQAAVLSMHSVVAIGGIDETNALAVIKAGAHGIAAIGVFHQARNPELTTTNLRQIIDRTEHV